MIDNATNWQVYTCPQEFNMISIVKCRKSFAATVHGAAVGARARNKVAYIWMTDAGYWLWSFTAPRSVPERHVIRTTGGIS